MPDGLSLETGARAIAGRFDVALPPSFDPPGGIAPGDPVLVLGTGSPGSAEVATWGANFDGKTEVTAVHVDDLDDRAVLRRAFDRGRILVLVDVARLGTTTVGRADGAPIAIGGIRDPVGSSDGVALIAVDGADVAPDPLPVVIPPEQVEIWLHYSHASELSGLLVPPDPTAFRVEPADEPGSA